MLFNENNRGRKWKKQRKEKGSVGIENKRARKRTIMVPMTCRLSLGECLLGIERYTVGGGGGGDRGAKVQCSMSG